MNATVEEDAAQRTAMQATPAASGDIESFLLIIGAMKSGTTTLFEYLSQHPQIARSRVKEPRLFGKPMRRAAWQARCRRLWRDFDPARHRYAMEASTKYTKSRYRATPERIAKLGVETRMIYIVRDPVDRIESHIAHNIAEGQVGPDVGWDDPMLRQAIDVSRYARQLARYAKALPHQEILILDFEELKRDPLAVTRRCVDFLGIDKDFAFTPVPPANARSVSEGGPFRLSDDLRARLAAELAPDAQRLAARHGFDIAAWGLGEASAAAPALAPAEAPALVKPPALAKPAVRPKPVETPLIFHIGMAKTGSSAIQRAFLGSEAYLAGKGVLYPHNRALPELHNHKLLATRIAPLDKLPQHMARIGDPERVLREADAFLRDLKTELAERRPDLLLLSSETMFRRIGAGYGGRLRATFAGLGIVAPVFVAYLRRPSERYASGLQQVLRSLDKVVQPRPPQYRGAIEAYSDLFGAGCLRLHVFDRRLLKGGDVVADFVERHLAAYGVAFQGLAPVGNRNVSMSAEAMSILQAFRQTGPGEAATGGLRTALRQAEETLDAARLRLRPGITEMVDYASDEPLWLRDVHGVVFPDFDYAPLEAGRRVAPPERPLTLDEIVLVDPDRRRALLEALAGASWAKLPPRRDWLRNTLREAAIR